jgi:hypothetical protein
MTDYPPAGTWDVIDRHGEPRYVVEHDGKGGWWGVCQPDRPEDCYVLAASKDLLAALKESLPYVQNFVQRYIDSMRGSHEDRTKEQAKLDGVRAAIAKAEGR